jgi:hypothetical protein
MELTEHGDAERCTATEFRVNVQRCRALLRTHSQEVHPVIRSSLVVLTVLFAAFPAIADEGMWMPQQVPLMGQELVERGLEIDPASFSNLTGFPMGAIVSTGGCSASFVSPMGLIATNHHCVRGPLQYNSTPERNLLEEGFLARSLEEEIPADPGRRIYVTVGIDDVTSQILGKLNPRLSDEDRQKEIERREKRIVSECEKPGGLRCRVASFFEGTEYHRTTQLEIRDVRLVYAPASGIGYYGGEIDNWMWPRHTGDFSFLRAWVGPDGKPADYSPDNVPYRPEHHLRVSTQGIAPGEFIMVAGYPGVTRRYQTAERVRENIEFTFPTSIEYRRALLDMVEARGREDSDVAIRNASRVGSLSNFLKKFQGTLDAFEKRDLLSMRMAEEARIEELYADRPQQFASFREAITGMSQILERERATRERDALIPWLYFSSPMLSQADTLYRLAVERQKKDLDRNASFQERNWPSIEAGIARNQRSIEPGTERDVMHYLLHRAVELPADQRIDAIDNALEATGENGAPRQIEAFLDRLFGETTLGELEVRQSIFRETPRQMVARRDPMIDFAIELRKLQDEREASAKRDEGAMSRFRPVYIQALRDVRGGLLAPDANSTLRFTFGEVRGYRPQDGVWYEPMTTIAGLVAKHTGEAPFDAPATLLERAAAESFGPWVDSSLDTLAVNFLSTADITNGNSGSAVLNGRAELVGLAFDGNYEAMGSDFVVIPELSRAIAVDARYMLWIMGEVDGAGHLLEEMGVR